MEKNTKKAIFFAIKAVIVASVVFVAALGGITNYTSWQEDALLKINYICATGMKPGTLALLMYDNGTHTIDMTLCKWIKNADPEKRSEERDELRAMYCSEIVARHDSGEPYVSYHNQMFAESQVSACTHVGLGGR